MAQYQVMTYRVPSAWPSGAFGMGTPVELPDDWTPLNAVRQGETILVLCYQQVGAPPPEGGAAPVLDTVTPNTLPAGTSPATIDLTGSGFDTSCVIYADATPRATFYLDATHLQYTSRPDLQTGPATVQIVVQGDNGTSNALPFSFT